MTAGVAPLFGEFITARALANTIQVPPTRHNFQETSVAAHWPTGPALLREFANVWNIND